MTFSQAHEVRTEFPRGGLHRLWSRVLTHLRMSNYLLQGTYKGVFEVVLLN